MAKFKVFLAILPLLCSCSLYSQNDTSFILPQLRIYVTENGKDIYYSFEKYKFNLFSVNDKFLTADTHRYNYSTGIDEIRQVSFRSGNNGWTMAGYGAALGFVLGFWAGGYFTIDGPVNFNINTAIPAGLVIALPFGLIGGLVGMLSPSYEDYDLRNIPGDYKRALLKKIFKKNKVNTF